MRRLPALAALVIAPLLLSPVQAADVSVVGVFRNKAVLVVDGAKPKTYSIGATVGDDMRLVAVNSAGATFEVNGKRETIALGGYASRTQSARDSVTLHADTRGHYVAQGQINGGSVRMLVDTGATLIALPATEARRLGIDYKNGRIGYVNTANGTVPAYMVRLDRVKVGDIEIHGVDAVVQEQGLPIILLGMSFLNRTEMRREGERMVLTKRF